MITKLVSSKVVIAKLLADLNLQEHELRISDVRNWIGEAVEKIGAVTKFNHVVSGVDGEPYLKLDGFQSPLPCNLHQLQQVAYSRTCNGPWQPMRKATGSFAKWDCGSKNNAKDCKQNTNPSTDLQYALKPGYIMCNTRDGYLKLSYNAVPTDNDFYPMVPDLASYQEALYWYISMKMMYPKFLRGDMDQLRYGMMQNSWIYHSKQAYGDMMMPNMDEMESIKNNWNKMYPEIDEHDTFYSHVGEEQEVYNQQYG